MVMLSNSESKIKVCFIARTAYALFNPAYGDLPGATHGGAEVDLYLLAKELVKDPRYDVSFIVGDFGQPEKEVIDGVTIYKCFLYRPPNKKSQEEVERRKKKNNIIKFLRKIPIIKTIVTHLIFGNKIVKINDFKRLTKVFKKVDADIYFQEAAGTLTGVSCLLSKIFGKKFVYRTAHDVDCNGQYLKDSLEEGLVDGYLYEWGIKRADALITQNIGNQKQLLDTFKLNSVVIKNAYPISDEVSNKKESILWVSRSATWKQPHLFLELAKDNPKSKFIMICPKANEEKECIDWNLLKKDAGSIKNMEFIGYVPFEEIDEYFKNSILFINTSIYEGYPNTYVQSTKNFSPIVSLTVNPDNFLDRYDCGLCANGDFEVMRKQLVEILGNKERLGEMSVNAYKYAKKEHDIVTVADRYKMVFEDLMK